MSIAPAEEHKRRILCAAVRLVYYEIITLSSLFQMFYNLLHGYRYVINAIIYIYTVRSTAPACL